MRSRHASMATASCAGSSSLSELTASGALMITSWWPAAAWAVKRSGLASGSGSTASWISAGYRFGTARTVQPGVSGGPPFGRTAYTSGGVWSSWPGANGSRSRSIGGHGVDVEVAAGAAGAGGGDDAAQAGQRVDAELVHPR